MIHVAIVEDLEDYRNGLMNLFNWSEGYNCIGAFTCAEEAMQQIPLLQPDVALIDIGLPGKNGIELVEYLLEHSPRTLSIMCTAYDEDEKIFKALEAGAYGYILKSTSPVGIIDAVQLAMNGGSPMSSQVARKVIASFKKPAPDTTYNLTQREQEVLGLLAKGMLYKEIADQLSISIDTVKSHCFKMYEKLHVSNRTEAVNKYHSRR